MGERWKHLLLPWYNHRARQIQDPLKRLKYLRSVGVRPEEILTPFVIPWRQAAAGLALVLFAGIIILRTGASARATSKGGGSAAAKAPVATRDYVFEPMTASERKVWLVEQKPGEEVYSNGLRIETNSTAPHEPRQNEHIEVDGLRFITGAEKPVGIVFHTAESHMEEFEADNNNDLRRAGQWLLQYVARHHFYHYLIDRFGRVHRVVPEEHAANHAGRSIWGDSQNTYVDLNRSFIAISLESKTAAGVLISDTVTPAQLIALRMLTVMLRLKYDIADDKCVTHAQVSVNPDNFRIGDHTDWASNFPFGEVGLPDNYLLPSPAILAFGFSYDDAYKAATGARMWKGLEASDKLFEVGAASHGLTTDAYRSKLKRRYRQALEAIKAVNAAKDRGTTSGETALPETRQQLKQIQ